MESLTILNGLRAESVDEMRQAVGDQPECERFVADHQAVVALIEGLQPYEELADERMPFEPGTLSYLESWFVTHHYVVEHSMPPPVAQVIVPHLIDKVNKACYTRHLLVFLYKLGYARAMADFDRPRQ